MSIMLFILCLKKCSIKEQRDVTVRQKSCKIVQTFWKRKQPNVLLSFLWHAMWLCMPKTSAIWTVYLFRYKYCVRALWVRAFLMLIQQICYTVVLFCKQINFCSILCSVTLAAEICKCRFNAITTQPCYVHVHENDSQQVCVYIPTSADNVTLLAYTAQCRAAVRLAAAAPGGRRYRSISPARRVHSSKPAAARVDHGSGPSAGRVRSGHQNRENQRFRWHAICDRLQQRHHLCNECVINAGRVGSRKVRMCLYGDMDVDPWSTLPIGNNLRHDIVNFCE